MKIKALLTGTLILSFAVASSPVMAVEKGDWLMRGGVTYVAPKSDNHSVVSVDSAASIGLNFSYMMTSNLSLEVLAAYPFEHDIRLKGSDTKVATTEHLPPTVSLQYHFMPTNAFKPYVGLGVNYTFFFSTKTMGPLDGLKLDLGNSWGLEGEIGADFMMSDKWLLNFSARYIDIETKATLGGDSLGTVEIDPWVYSLMVGYKF